MESRCMWGPASAHELTSVGKREPGLQVEERELSVISTGQVQAQKGW